ncbi:hypothetical protein B0I72DRAFT_151381 [Yarrowia lipolytica]|jgi:syntaxin 8|uniref:YALI0E17875p n=2 Tax=Yarrowia lipolytica TaxID=4952 RepID=Q6C5I1_YARLI|nr:YALI0E17875p [Yarrowia lipolytica CLIB122]AOW05570.1 hypothetical protein YALI1_E21203g [Yarrowia lipolytica]KAB8282750.1 hypothetical protein BKA91DRAFT_137991 [Yarrowia lipolytica]KAE8173762.1 hypothetical protein BKA90DRAFT_109146 [Yarrowia lipolytica]KAJ8057056.1 hypothetical protein LXG23DRAFT_33933 [Yarrowia lipolytica]QNP99042.1 Putative syntaxin-8B [Yarrowia lipolytica]|eukprot:XP_504081.1 YALI0E17875p [Yarrowia lipolytica CLIB122]
MTNLVLLVDQTQVAIDERERLTLLGIKAAESDDRDIERALENIKQGLLDNRQAATHGKDVGTLTRVREDYHNLVQAYEKISDTDLPDLYLNESLFVSKKKSVKFRDNNLEETSGAHSLNDQHRDFEPYRDDPEALIPERYTDEEPSPAARFEGLSTQQVVYSQREDMGEQDERLSTLAQSVSRQHQLSLQIGAEVDSHNVMLDDIEAQVDNSDGRLNLARRRLDDFSRRAKESGSLLTIIILVFILIILIVLLS